MSKQKESLPSIINFPEVNCIFAKEQSQYRQLLCNHTADGLITCCWRFSIKDRLKILFSGIIWHQVLTFNNPLQPQLILVDKPQLNK